MIKKTVLFDVFSERSFQAAALVSLFSLTAIVLYLFREGLPIFSHVSVSDFFLGSEWFPADEQPSFGILPMLAGSAAVTLLSCLIAVPFGVLTAVYLSEIASERTRSVLKPFVELMAAVPSVVLGFIGVVVVAPFLQDVFGAATGLNLLTASFLLAVMAVPTICTISEDGLRAVPKALKESSLALGATKFETLTRITLPAALSGITTASMLGVSRAIGETMVVLMVAGGASMVPESIFDPVRPMPAAIAAEMAEAPFGGTHSTALFAIGLVLFFCTFLFNAAAFRISQKYKFKADRGF